MWLSTCRGAMNVRYAVIISVVIVVVIIVVFIVVVIIISIVIGVSTCSNFKVQPVMPIGYGERLADLDKAMFLIT